MSPEGRQTYGSFEEYLRANISPDWFEPFQEHFQSLRRICSPEISRMQELLTGIKHQPPYRNYGDAVEILRPGKSYYYYHSGVTDTLVDSLLGMWDRQGRICYLR